MCIEKCLRSIEFNKSISQLICVYGTVDVFVAASIVEPWYLPHVSLERWSGSVAQHWNAIYDRSRMKKMRCWQRQSPVFALVFWGSINVDALPIEKILHRCKASKSQPLYGHRCFDWVCLGWDHRSFIWKLERESARRSLDWNKYERFTGKALSRVCYSRPAHFRVHWSMWKERTTNHWLTLAI